MKKIFAFGCVSIMLLAALTGCGAANNAASTASQVASDAMSGAGQIVSDAGKGVSKTVEDASKNVSSMAENGKVSDSDGVIGNTESTQETTESLQDDSTAALAEDMNE